jgi:N-acetylmuramic acid 6-phosphate (MurNAc-6-P) etherase
MREAEFCDPGEAHDLTRTANPDLRQLPTEQILPTAADLDRMSSLDIVRLINAEDATIAEAVHRALPQIARAIDVVAAGLRQGGRLIYVGAGTSGRLGALDASEIPPTFNTDPRTVQYIMAGGPKALGASTEASEDDTRLALAEIKKRKPGKHDIVLGIASSGRTSTGAMTRLGYVYGNLMVSVWTKNEKLVQRAIRIVEQATGADHEAAARALKASGNRTPVAVVMLAAGVTKSQAAAALKKTKGHVRQAIEQARSSTN